MREHELVGLDFETYGAVDLRTHGLHRYVNDPTFKVLIGRTKGRDMSGSGLVGKYDFVFNPKHEAGLLMNFIGDRLIVAHNAGFEQACLEWLGISLPSSRFIDSAVVARAAGGGGHLEAAAPQLLNVNKIEDGSRLIKLFSVPGKYQDESMMFNPQIIEDHPEDWEKFDEYCGVDADLGFQLVVRYLLDEKVLSPVELQNMWHTMDMNKLGWPVDLDLVKEMQRRYQANMDLELARFRQDCNAPDLNLNSLKQMKEWCAERGIKATSFDEKHVASLEKRIADKLTKDGLNMSAFKVQDYSDVLRLLRTKQILGGSSLKKLQVILDTVGEDGRLHDQYLHIGAGQTYRTTGRSVQMQNLKRLGAEVADVEELFDEDTQWDNEELANNLRQTFKSSHPQGELIVGDFKSVESRGLAWEACEQWKLDAYFRGDDLYKVQAGKIFGIPHVDVNKQQRQTGKVGELSCGYGAGPGAVQSFAAGMGITMTEGEATSLVYDWRDACPATVELWRRIDNMLDTFMQGGTTPSTPLNERYSLQFQRWTSPASLRKQRRGVVSLKMVVYDSWGEEFFHRWFHGLYRSGRDIHYFKPSDRKTGDLWKDTFTDPKTKQVRHYNLYGGKVTGILTQSLCRELFFACLSEVAEWCSTRSNVDLIGQFHDEIVLDWWPSAASDAVSLGQAQTALLTRMRVSPVPNFPLDAAVKSAHRYIK